MKLRVVIVLAGLLLTLFAAHAQTTPPVTAGALNQANLRAQPGLEFDIVGQIVAGTRYPVIGRSEFYPWVLIADPATSQPLGWVFSDLVTFQGNIESVPFSTQIIGGAPASLPTTTLAPSGSASTTPLFVPSGSATASPPTGAPATQPPTLPPNAITGLVLGEINIRYGPGTEYDRLGVAQAGDVLTITARHTQLPWVQVSYTASPNGFGWVLAELLDIQGNLESVQAISQTTFRLPTLTPTPSVAQQAAVGDISPEFAALGDRLWNRMLDAQFDPQTSRLGALFVMNLSTGETLAFDSNIAFSGMSLSKIGILTTLFRRINDTPDDATASIIAEVMICSENISTNRMLAQIGDGNPYTGADRVSEFFEQLGLTNTYMYTPYANDPFITPQAPQAPARTDADQVRAQPDPYNQMTVADMGALLHSLYQCALDGTGPLMERFPGEYTAMECRKIIDVMTYNHINNFIEAGVPEGIKVAHKHGWVDDTHGDAGIVFTPGGNFIFVIALHNPVWMNFDESGAVISENAREVYNYFNPDAPLDETRIGTVPECNLLGNPGVIDLLSPTFGIDPTFQ